MKQWIILKGTKVIGGQRTPKNVLPPASPGTTQVEFTDEEMRGYRALVEQARNEGRQPVINMVDRKLELEVDARIFIDVSIDTIDPAVNAPSTLTVRQLINNGSVNRTVNTTEKLLIAEKLFKLEFTRGVATHSVIFRQSGTVVIESTLNIKVKDTLTIDVIE